MLICWPSRMNPLYDDMLGNAQDGLALRTNDKNSILDIIMSMRAQSISLNTEKSRWFLFPIRRQ
ncbi:MAG TPA: hypothetical protein DEB40_01025 [Elusimicrobia bacterium]|nr:hypothetical protein [Elusimicrobiota bacterium]HBT60312.1 hypothetical protein [Elusimicrobiota bacterium]